MQAGLTTATALALYAAFTKWEFYMANALPLLDGCGEQAEVHWRVKMLKPLPTDAIRR